MAINSTPKEKPTGDGNPTAGGANNDWDFPTGQRSGKAFETLRAAFAMRGHYLHRTHMAAGSGQMTFWDERWGQVRYLPTIETARRFLEQIGGRL